MRVFHVTLVLGVLLLTGCGDGDSESSGSGGGGPGGSSGSGGTSGSGGASGAGGSGGVAGGGGGGGSGGAASGSCSDPSKNPYIGTCVDGMFEPCFDATGACTVSASSAASTALKFANGARVDLIVDNSGKGFSAGVRASGGATCGSVTGGDYTATLNQAQWNGSASPTDVVKALQLADGSWEFKCKDGSKFTKTKAEVQAGVGCMFGSKVEACAITNADINNVF